MEYWSSLPRVNESDPLTVVGEGGRQAGTSLREAVHAKLLAMHAAAFKARNVSQEGLAPPSSLAYSVWAHSGTFPAGDRGLLSGPQDVVFAPSLAAACRVPSLQDYEDRVQGTGAWGSTAPGLHFTNNDLAATPSSQWHGPWAEASLLTAERILAKAFRLRRPSWLNETYYATNVARGRAASLLPSEELLV